MVEAEETTGHDRDGILQVVDACEGVHVGIDVVCKVLVAHLV